MFMDFDKEEREGFARYMESLDFDDDKWEKLKDDHYENVKRAVELMKRLDNESFLRYMGDYAQLTRKLM